MENTAPTLAAATLAHTTGRVTIPADMDPIVVLGIADQVLRALERGFPHVRFLGTGRAGDPAAKSLGGRLRELNLPQGRLKTGTPPRIDGRTIDFSQLTSHTILCMESQ